MAHAWTFATDPRVARLAADLGLSVAALLEELRTSATEQDRFDERLAAEVLARLRAGAGAATDAVVIVGFHTPVGGGDSAYDQECAFCRDYFPGRAMIENAPLCLHCAPFALRFHHEALNLRRTRGIARVEPFAWERIARENAGRRQCAECGRRVDTASDLSSTLGADHVCLSCALNRAQQRAAPQKKRRRRGPGMRRDEFERRYPEEYYRHSDELGARPTQLDVAERLGIAESTLNKYLAAYDLDWPPPRPGASA